MLLTWPQAGANGSSAGARTSSACAGRC